MKKAIIVFILFIIIGFIPFQQHNSVDIKSNYFDVCQQLAGGNQTKTPKFNPGKDFNITAISANVFSAATICGPMSYNCFYTVAPGIKNNYAIIAIDAPTNVFKWLISQVQPSVKPDALVLNLKAFMENARIYYGFNIIEKDVAENYIAVKKETVPIQNKFPEINRAVKDLNSFIAQNNAKAIHPLSCSYYPHQADSVQVLVGIPVNKQIQPTANITCMRMPGGKMLVGDFNGKYSDRQKLYNAMEKYIQDHSLSKQIAPFERYLDNRIPASDTDSVNMQINYPVL
ncbi:GyrI-like domain-containing protein [Mucilaginibacter aquaedulcis]|uniref:GyrI-like domain-containing protein n=1 Tax=Mucilaginibacter aquaedulcis TaxID=1187081 RepID=UPI0025B4362D|nr:GyrI-like domain-containing protein [Mucilaginibacter aquaedulcis]MDN3550457.1 GyrI-like domain-containing protein [Mucilaginibacter aquaedulcis]